MSLHSCHSRPRPSGHPYVVQDGWYTYKQGATVVRVARWKEIPGPVAPECKGGRADDPSCFDCPHLTEKSC